MQKQRRKFLLRLGQGIIAILQGCNMGEEEKLIAGKLEELAFQKYWLREFNGKKIIIFYNEGNPYTLSLVCTHKKCTVRFFPKQAQFVCPCHEGKYDLQGNVVSGKPPRPLARYKTIVNLAEVVVWNQILNE